MVLEARVQLGMPSLQLVEREMCPYGGVLTEMESSSTRLGALKKKITHMNPCPAEPSPSFL